MAEQPARFRLPLGLLILAATVGVAIGLVLALLRTPHTGVADPWADTVRSVQSFATRAGWRGEWHWLLGTKQQLRPVWRAYDFAVKRTPADVLHGTVLYVIDPRGDVRAGYLFPFAADPVAREVRRLSAS